MEKKNKIKKKEIYIYIRNLKKEGKREKGHSL